ncbi:MAG: helix-turn-helix domain-containing protein [Mycoplasmataceae bacterium]|nr:helix-turn-helix domain-containing protein [Mycoplasmataceae bacterium]
METFGKKLSELRKQKGLSQEQLALDLNISQSSVSNYESGATKPDTDILQKIAEYFKIPIAHFFSDEKTIFYTNENNGGNIGNFSNNIFNTVSEKLIELYEWRIKDLEDKIQKMSGQKSNFT